jgi:hypothetical protein
LRFEQGFADHLGLDVDQLGRGAVAYHAYRLCGRVEELGQWDAKGRCDAHGVAQPGVASTRSIHDSAAQETPLRSACSSRLHCLVRPGMTNPLPELILQVETTFLL